MKDIYLYTHGGGFHVDDVLSTSLLELYFEIKEPDEKHVFHVARITDEDITSIGNSDNSFIYDIGLGKYDHHQADNEARADGIEYASLGKLWRESGKELFPDIWQEMDEKYIKILDYYDNHGWKNAFLRFGEYFRIPSSTVHDISCYNVNWDETVSDYERFLRAVELGKAILIDKVNEFRNTPDYTPKRDEFKSELNRLKERKKLANSKAKKIMDDIIEHKDPFERLLVLDNFIPFKGSLYEKDIYSFVVSPSSRSGWSAEAISVKGEFLCEFADNDKSTFRHNSGFYRSYKTKQDAIDACRKALELQREQRETDAANGKGAFVIEVYFEVAADINGEVFLMEIPALIAISDTESGLRGLYEKLKYKKCPKQSFLEPSILKLCPDLPENHMIMKLDYKVGYRPALKS